MRKVYCDFCKNEIKEIYHEINIDNKSLEVCDECYLKCIQSIKKLFEQEPKGNR